MPTRHGCVMNRRSDSAKSSVTNRQAIARDLAISGSPLRHHQHRSLFGYFGHTANSPSRRSWHSRSVASEPRHLRALIRASTLLLAPLLRRIHPSPALSLPVLPSSLRLNLLFSGSLLLLTPYAALPPRLRLAARSFRTANIGASFHRTSRLAIAQALCAARSKRADSAECQLWQRERRQATIKASAPTYLPHREAQAAQRSSPSRTGGPPLNQVKGKSYATAVGVPSKVVETSTHPRQPGAEQRRPPSGPKKQGSVKPRPLTKATFESHLDQENTNLRLLLRAVVDLLPPENQLRSIYLQAGGVPPPNSHHG
ncbi:hypothetical protein MTO96_036781 [Rhipicephalus appendiculatus]